MRSNAASGTAMLCGLLMSGCFQQPLNCSSYGIPEISNTPERDRCWVCRSPLYQKKGWSKTYAGIRHKA